MPAFGKITINMSPRLDAFEVAAKKSPFPLCYNGDIFSVADYERICQRFPRIQSVMLGRGLMANPALVRQIQGGSPCTKRRISLFSQSYLSWI